METYSASRDFRRAPWRAVLFAIYLCLIPAHAFGQESEPDPELRHIKHIVVIYQENWSFDSFEQRDLLLPARSSDSFLVSDLGRPLEVAAVRRTFYELYRWTGLRQGAINRGPRLHDFRHRFAVETLIRWYRAGQDVQRRLPVLSTYLGHAHVSDTYWYVTHCPELMEWAVKRLESQWEVQP